MQHIDIITTKLFYLLAYVFT